MSKKSKNIFLVAWQRGLAISKNQIRKRQKIDKAKYLDILNDTRKRYDSNPEAFIYEHYKSRASLELQPMLFGIVSGLILFVLLQGLLSSIWSLVKAVYIDNANSDLYSFSIFVLGVLFFLILIGILILSKSFKEDRVEYYIEKEVISAKAKSVCKNKK